jgi:pyruvate,water dikinase
VQGAVNPDEFFVYKPSLEAGRPALLRRTVGAKAVKMFYSDHGAAEPVEVIDVPDADRPLFCLTEAEVE